MIILEENLLRITMNQMLVYFSSNMRPGRDHTMLSRVLFFSSPNHHLMHGESRRIPYNRHCTSIHLSASTRGLVILRTTVLSLGVSSYRSKKIHYLYSVSIKWTNYFLRCRCKRTVYSFFHKSSFDKYCFELSSRTPMMNFNRLWYCVAVS